MKTLKQRRYEDYDGFVAKFRHKKTTDDCMTPPAVYEAIRAWAVKEYGLEDRKIVRPFWPGGDYERFRYPKGCVVIDNPPFSILAKIIRFYCDRKRDFFLFSPALTVASSSAANCGVVIPPRSGAKIRFENGACLPIAFVTNMGGYAIQVRPDLGDAIRTAMREQKREMTSNNPQIPTPTELPPEVATPARLLKLTSTWRVPRGEAQFVRTCGAGKYSLFGGGWLISERAAAERAAAERAAAHKVELSAREREIVKQLGKEKA